jgi:predicted dehydrogenase
MSETRPLRIGLLGVARITRRALVDPARHVPGAVIAAVAARDPARAAAFARRYAIPQVHTTYADLVANPTLDAIYNPLPNSLHAPWTLAALAAGKHVLCEKPVAANAVEAARMAAAATAAGRVLMEAFHYRYHPLFLRMQAIVQSGELGPVRHIEAHMCLPMRRINDIRFDYALAGGAGMDVGCYTVNLIRGLAGAEPEVVAARAWLRRPEVDRAMAADLRFADGRTAHLSCSLLSACLLRLSATVRGERGVLHVINPYLPHRFHRLTLHTAASRRREHFSGDTTYTYQLRAFVDAVQRGAPLPTDGRDAVANMRVVDALYTAAGLRLRGV